MADSMLALGRLVATLADDHHLQAYLCDGDPRSAVAWSVDLEITVRLRAVADDEIWVLAGAGLLARVVADSAGEFEIDPIVTAILGGQAVEIFGPGGPTDPLIPLGWKVKTPGGEFSADVEPGRSVVEASIVGPMARTALG